MERNLQTIQGVLSLLAVLCIAAGWFNFLPLDIRTLLSDKIFYILVSLSFIVQGRMLKGTKFMYPMYASAALCLIGIFLPADSAASGIKTLGLLAGVIISFTSRSAARR